MNGDYNQELCQWWLIELAMDLLIMIDGDSWWLMVIINSYSSKSL